MPKYFILSDYAKWNFLIWFLDCSLWVYQSILYPATLLFIGSRSLLEDSLAFSIFETMPSTNGDNLLLSFQAEFFPFHQNCPGYNPQHNV